MIMFFIHTQILSRKGQSLIGLLIACVGSIILLLAISRGLISQFKAQRGIFTNLELDEMSTLFHLMTDNASSCQLTPLIGLNIAPLLSPTPTPVPINNLSLNASGGTRKMNQISLVQIIPNGSPGSYLATIQLNTSLVGQSLTNRNPLKKFFINVVVDTNNKITSCGLRLPASTDVPPPISPTPAPIGGFTILVVHGQSDPNPVCPSGWAPLYPWMGYSYLGSGAGGSGVGGGNTTVNWAIPEDLGGTGSCLEQFRPMPYFESTAISPDRGFYIKPSGVERWAYTLWLYSRTQRSVQSGSIGISNNIGKISRCIICSRNAPVVVRHSMTDSVPACPVGWNTLWQGYSLGGMTLDQTNGVRNLSSTGSCLKSFMPVPFIECGGSSSGADNGEFCQYGRENDFAAWISSTNMGQSPTSISSSVIDSRVSRCSVCSPS